MGSEMCIRDSTCTFHPLFFNTTNRHKLGSESRKQWLKHLEVDKYLATVEILLLSCKERKSVACRVKVAVDCRSPPVTEQKKLWVIKATS